MANSSIKIVNKSIYTIDIKDENDNIIHILKFNLNDANFPVRALELYDSAFQEMERLEEQEEKIKNKLLDEGVTQVPNIENLTQENIKENEDILSPTMREFFCLEANGYNKLREILDKFLGTGTCQSIFGDYNDRETFKDFLNGLLPELEKMGVKMQNIQKNMYKKHAPKQKRII